MKRIAGEQTCPEALELLHVTNAIIHDEGVGVERHIVTQRLPARFLVQLPRHLLAFSPAVKYSLATRAALEHHTLDPTLGAAAGLGRVRDCPREAEALDESRDFLQELVGGDLGGGSGVRGGVRLSDDAHIHCSGRLRNGRVGLLFAARPHVHDKVHLQLLRLLFCT